MIGSFASGATAPQVAKNGTQKLSQPFEELQGSNLEFKLITPKPITGTFFDPFDLFWKQSEFVMFD